MTQLSASGEPFYKDSVGGVRVFARSTANGGAGTIELVLVRKGVRLAVFPATVTATAYRSDAAGTGGSYICTVSFTATSSDKLDLLGMEEYAGLCGPGLSGDDAGACWMIGCSSLGGLTNLTLELATTKEV